MSIPETTPAAEPVSTEPSAVKTPVMDTETTVMAPKTEDVTQTPAAVDSTTAPAATEAKTGETATEATSALEGVLGYKAPGIIHFRYVKHFFWFSDEPTKSQDLAQYMRTEKSEHAHPGASWAQETGKGVLFYAKRAEDKATPAGLIVLADATDIAKEGSVMFSFRVHTHTHKFEAANSAERDSWFTTVQQTVGVAKGMKEDITGRDSYKKTLDGYFRSPLAGTVAAGAATGAGAAAVAHKKEEDPTTNGVAKETDGANEAEAKKEPVATKSRSQSRKRLSVFGGVLGKKEEKKEEPPKELTEEEKAEKEAADKKAAEERAVADEKAKQDRLAAEEKAKANRLAAEEKAKADRLAAEEKAKQEKAERERKREAEAKDKADRKAAEKKAKDEKKAVEEKAKEEKRAKAAAEKDKADKERQQRKAEADAQKEQARKEAEVKREEARKETEVKREEVRKEREAQKAKEAAEAAAVAAAPVAVVAADKKHEDKKEEKAEEKSGATTPTDKKSKRASVFGGLFGKKDATSPTDEKDSEVSPAVPAKDNKVTEVPPVSETAPKIDEPAHAKPLDTAAVVGAADGVKTPSGVDETNKELAPTSAETSTGKTDEKSGLMGFIKKQEARFAGKKEESAADTPATESGAETSGAEDRPAREKRRTSLFGGLGTLKKKSTNEDGSEDATETKREKSPMPSKIGSIFRKPSKAVKPTEAAKETPATTSTTDAVKTDAPTTTDAAVTPVPESKTVGDVPEELTTHDQTTVAPTESKTVEATA